MLKLWTFIKNVEKQLTISYKSKQFMNFLPYFFTIPPNNLAITSEHCHNGLHVTLFFLKCNFIFYFKMQKKKTLTSAEYWIWIFSWMLGKLSRNQWKTFLRSADSTCYNEALQGSPYSGTPLHSCWVHTEMEAHTAPGDRSKGQTADYCWFHKSPL